MSLPRISAVSSIVPSPPISSPQPFPVVVLQLSTGSFLGVDWCYENGPLGRGPLSSASQPWVPHGDWSCCYIVWGCVDVVVYWNCIGGVACWPAGWLVVLAADALAMSRNNCVSTGWLRCVSRASRISLKKRSGFSTSRCASLSGRSSTMAIRISSHSLGMLQHDTFKTPKQASPNPSNFGALGRTTSWSPKSQCVYGPESEIVAVTFFAKNGAALPKSNTFASVV